MHHASPKRTTNYVVIMPIVEHTWAITETIDLRSSSPLPCVTQDNQHKQMKIGKFWRCP
jgi:hypothetical protein